MGRMSDVGQNAEATIASMVRTLALYPELRSAVMVSSIRTPDHARQAFQTGAAALTVPASVLRAMVDSPLTTGP